MTSPIAQIRRDAGLSQHDFAILAGVGLSTLVAIESGALKPNDKILKALEALGVDSVSIKEAHRCFVEAKRKVMSAKLQSSTQKGD